MTTLITTFPQMLHRFKGEIKRALPNNISAERMSRIALTSYRQNPDLARCDPANVFACIIQAAQLGLELDGRGHAFLIAYKQNCTLVPGWKGLLDLSTRSGRCSVSTGVIYDGDIVDYKLGTNQVLNIMPQGEYREEKITHAFSIGRVKGQEGNVIEMWPIAKLKLHRDKFNKQGKKHYSFKHWEMYIRKVTLLQALKYLPSSADLNLATQLSYSGEDQSQILTIDDAIDGTFSQPFKKTISTSKEDDDCFIDSETGEVTKTLPAMTDDHFDGVVGKWETLIKSGKETPERILTKVCSFYLLTNEQKITVSNFGKV